MPTTRWHTHVLFLVAAMFYLAALAYRHDSVPGPPCNEVAEEALSGYLMIQNHDLRPIYTELNPNGHEALHVLLVGALAHVFPGDPLAILIPAWVSAIALLGLLSWFAKLNPDILDETLVLPFAVSCMWLFHYSRTGLRTVSSPALLLLFVIVLQLSWKRRPHATDLLAGMLLALGTYAYSSLRLAVVAFAIFAVAELWQAYRCSREEFSLRLKKLALAAAGFALVFSWAAVHAIRQPETFFGRGLYVFRGGTPERLANLFWSVLLPVHYDDRYLQLVGPGHVFDSVALGLPAANLAAVPPLLGILFLVGLIMAARRHRDRPALRYLLVFYVVAIVVLGIAGPSLTRFFVIFPLVAIFGAMPLSRLVHERPRLRIATVVALYSLAAYGIFTYLRSGPSSDPTRIHGAEMGASVGRRARSLCEQGGTPLCVVGRERNLVSYLTIGHWPEVRLREFHERAVRLGELQADLEHATAVLVDDSPNLEPLVRYLTKGGAYSSKRGSHFTEFVPRQPEAR